MPLQHGAEELVPQTKVESEPRSDAPIVLRENGIGDAVVVDVSQVIDVSTRRLAGQERCKATAARALGSRIVGVLCPEAQLSAGCSRLVDGEFLRAVLGAKFPGVSARDESEGVGYRVGVLYLVRGQICGAAQCCHV